MIGRRVLSSLLGVVSVGCAGNCTPDDPDELPWFPVIFDSPLQTVELSGDYITDYRYLCTSMEDPSAIWTRGHRELSDDEVARALQLVPVLGFMAADAVTFRVSPKQPEDPAPGLLHVEYIIDGHTIVDTFELRRNETAFSPGW